MPYFENVFLSKTKLITILVLILLVLSIFFLSSKPFIYNVRSGTLDLTKLPLVVLTAFVHEGRAVLFFHRSYWQNLRLANENENLKKMLAQDALDREENARLRELLELKKKSVYRTIAAKVIGKDFYSLRPYLIIDKGRAAGIRKYAPVLTPAGLVGKVLEVGLFSSKVILINDPDLSVPAVNVRTREQGLVSGSLGGSSKLRFLDLDSDVESKDLIVTSGINMSYPEGIPIGVVKTVATEASGLGKFAVLELAVRISSCDEVLVVIS